MHELPGAICSKCNAYSRSAAAKNDQEDSIDYVANAGVLSNIELLEADIHHLKTTKVCQNIGLTKYKVMTVTFLFRPVLFHMLCF